MKCEDARERLFEDIQPGDPELREHLEACPLCSALAVERAVYDDSPPLDDLFAGVTDRLDAERGLRAWLRARPTPLRLGLGAVSLILLVGATALTWGRIDMALYPSLRLAIEVAALSVLSLAGIAASMHPPHRPPLPSGVVAAIVGLALLLPTMGLLPMAHAAHPASMAGVGPDLLARASLSVLGHGCGSTDLCADPRASARRNAGRITRSAAAGRGGRRRNRGAAASLSHHPTDTSDLGPWPGRDRLGPSDGRGATVHNQGYQINGAE